MMTDKSTVSSTSGVDKCEVESNRRKQVDNTKINWAAGSTHLSITNLPGHVIYGNLGIHCPGGRQLQDNPRADV
jgi:hypothetical protein